MSSGFKDYYATLGVAKDADAAAIKKAFRKLAREHHPDVAKDKTSAEAKFKEINEAYEVLSDPEKRKKYDLLGEDWEHGGRAQGPAPEWQQGWGGGTGEAGGDFHFEGTGFSDFFEQYFSGGSRYGFPRGGAAGGGMGARRGNDIEGDIMVSLEEAMEGAVRPISLRAADPQTGKATTHSFQVRIPAGVTDGQRIRVPGQGEPGHGGGPAGDLYLRVRHAAHPDFTTQGADVFYDMDIAPWEAVLGAEVTVPSLDGPIKLRVPAGAENEQQLRVRGRGLPRKQGTRGDFHVVLHIVTPTEVSADERTLWEKLRDISRFRPRQGR